MTAPDMTPEERAAAIAQRLRNNRGRTEDREHIVCPACGYTHGDAWEWGIFDRATQCECDDCGAPLIVWAETDVTYYAKVRDEAVAALLAQEGKE